MTPISLVCVAKWQFRKSLDIIWKAPDGDHDEEFSFYSILLVDREESDAFLWVRLILKVC